MCHNGSPCLTYLVSLTETGVVIAITVILIATKISIVSEKERVVLGSETKLEIMTNVLVFFLVDSL